MQVRACRKAGFAQHEKTRLKGHPHPRGMDGALGAKAAAIPPSVRTGLEVLDLISRDNYGRLVLTEKGRRLIARIQ